MCGLLLTYHRSSSSPIIAEESQPKIVRGSPLCGPVSQACMTCQGISHMPFQDSVQTLLVVCGADLCSK